MKHNLHLRKEPQLQTTVVGSENDSRQVIHAPPLEFKVGYKTSEVEKELLKVRTMLQVGFENQGSCELFELLEYSRRGRSRVAE